MRTMDGSRDSYDGLVDRSPSILPHPPEPRLTINGVDVAGLLSGASMRLRHHLAVVARDDDADRLIKEDTARYHLGEIEARAERMGKEQTLSRLLVLIDVIEREGYPRAAEKFADWISDAKLLHAAMAANRPGAFDAAIRTVWFSSQPSEAGDYARYQGVLADALS